MKTGSQTRIGQTRPAQQLRSRAARARIAAAAVELIADHGLHGVTHRRVAERANVSVAATTYYYASKFDILAEASDANMRAYTTALKSAVLRVDDYPRGTLGFRSFALRLLRNVTTRHRIGTLAWVEITLAGIRQSEGKVMAKDWATHINAEWVSAAQGLECYDPQSLARSGIDTMTGLIFMVLGLGLSAQDIDAVFLAKADPLIHWRPDVRDGQPATGEVKALSPKARETRGRIIAATIDTLQVDGPGLVNFRQVAMRAGLSQSALTYYFASAEDLMQAAQSQLFRRSKDRYRAALPNVQLAVQDLEGLSDLTATIFLREVVEFGPQNVATFTTWLEASRRPELRPLIWGAISDQARAWQRMIAPLNNEPASSLDGILAQAMFVGKMVRILSAGVKTADLVKVRREFRADLQALSQKDFWMMFGTNELKQLT